MGFCVSFASYSQALNEMALALFEAETVSLESEGGRPLGKTGEMLWRGGLSVFSRGRGGGDIGNALLQVPTWLAIVVRTRACFGGIVRCGRSARRQHCFV